MKNLSRIVTGLLAALLLASCSGLGKIELQDYRIVKAVPESFHSIKLVLDLKLANFGPELTLTQIQGEIFHGSESLGTFTVNDMPIPARSISVVTADTHILIDENADLLRLLNLAKDFNLDDYSISLSSKVKLGMAAKTFRIHKKPLKDLVQL